MHDVLLLSGAAAQVREQGDAVEAQPGDVELEGDADEGGHGVVEEDFGGEGEGEGARVGDVQRGLDVEGAGFRFVVAVVIVVW